MNQPCFQNKICFQCEGGHQPSIQRNKKNNIKRKKRKIILTTVKYRFYKNADLERSLIFLLVIYSILIDNRQMTGTVAPNPQGPEDSQQE